MPETRDLADLVAGGAAEHPDRLAVVEARGRSLTWAELEDQVARIATGLGEAGIVAGQRVMLVLGNRLEFVTAYLGVLRAQVVAVPVNPTSTTDELVRTIADSGSRLVVADETTIAPVRAAVGVVARAAAGDDVGLDADLVGRAVTPVVVAVDADAGDGELSFEGLRAVVPRDVPPLQDPEKLATLLYTSGTSGRPRAAMLTHRALLANLEQVAAVDPPMMRTDDVVLGVLPLFHVYGLNAVLGGVLRHRARLVLTDRFEPRETLELIDDQACTVVPLAPPVFTQWLATEQRDGAADPLGDRLRPVRLVLSGSAPLSAEVVDAFTSRTGLTVHQGYGLTEAAPVVTSTLCSEHLQNGSVGAALPGVELRLADHLGRSPEGDDPGEIHVRGANLFSGYWPDGNGGPDSEGWWATGDVGFLDPSGDLFLVDRIKDLVIVSGFNVYPIEVEEVIGEVDGVTGVAVVGAQDPETGEAVVAYVQATGADPVAVEDAVRRHCGVRLARFKQPSRVVVVDDLPLTVTGKVQKGRLRGLERRRALGLLE